MLLRFATLLLALLLPFSVAAQRIVPPTLAEAQRPLFDRLLSIEVASATAGTSNQVVPLWASPDGRLMAIVALSRGSGAPTLPPSPAFGGISDLRIVDATDLFSAGLRLRLGEGLHADMVLGQESASTIPIDFSGAPDCVNCLGELDAARTAGVLSAAIGLGWTAPGGVDLSFGLSWLDGRQSQLPILASGAFTGAPIDLALLEVQDVASYKLNSGQRLSARGTWQLDQGPVIDLTAALTRADLLPVWYGLPGSGLDLNQATLGLGINSGSLRGSIVGRISSLEEAGVAGSRRWSGLDLGVSWRTPWRGEVTVGAQNLFSAPLDAAAARDMDATQARMPYVQYRQDL